MLTRTDRRRFPVLFAVIAVLAMAMLFSPVQAQEGSAPDKPTGLEATATHDSVTLTWDDPGDDSITGYVILRRIPAVDPEGQFSELVSNTGTDATTYTDDTVSAETRYTYRIKAINEHGVSERSRWSHINVPAAPEPEEEQAAEPPDKPRGLETTATHDSVTLTWDDPQDDSITGYVILRRIPGVDPEGHFSELVSNTGTDATTYTDDTVSAETRYTYRIKAINEHGVSERSRWYHIDTPAAPEPEEEQAAEPPDKPRGLEATATQGQVVLTWDDPGDDSITGHVILRRIPGVDPEGHFSELVSNTGTDATTYTDDTVSAEARYTYRIKAVNGAGTSERSRWYHIDVPAAPEAAEGDDPDEQDDFPATAATTAEVEVGGSVTGRISSAGDADWFKVDLSGGVRYRRLQIDVEGDDTGRGDLPDPNVRLYDAGSAQINGTFDDNSGVDDNARTIISRPPGGTFYVQVAGASGTGTYTLSVIELGTDGDSEADTDFPSNDTTNGEVELGGSVTGNISPAGDYDWFKVELKADKSYQFDLKGSDGGGGTLGGLPYIRLYDSASNLVLEFGDSISVTTTEAGDYYVEASESSDEQTGTYTLSVRGILVSSDGPGKRNNVSEPSNDDCSANKNTACEVDVFGSVTGRIVGGSDEDWFRVEFEQGKRYQIDLKGEYGGGGTLADPFLDNIRDSSGNAIADTSAYDFDFIGGNLDSQILFTSTAAGTYYLVASKTDNTTGTYTLSVGLVPPIVPGPVRDIKVDYHDGTGQYVFWNAPDETDTGAQWITEFHIYGPGTGDGCDGYLLDEYVVEHPGFSRSSDGSDYWKVVAVGPAKFGVSAVNGRGEGPCVEGPDVPDYED